MKNLPTYTEFVNEENEKSKNWKRGNLNEKSHIVEGFEIKMNRDLSDKELKKLYKFVDDNDFEDKDIGPWGLGGSPIFTVSTKSEFEKLKKFFNKEFKAKFK